MKIFTASFREWRLGLFEKACTEVLFIDPFSANISLQQLQGVAIRRANVIDLSSQNHGSWRLHMWYRVKDRLHRTHLSLSSSPVPNMEVPSTATRWLQNKSFGQARHVKSQSPALYLGIHDIYRAEFLFRKDGMVNTQSVILITLFMIQKSMVMQKMKPSRSHIYLVSVYLLPYSNPPRGIGSFHHVASFCTRQNWTNMPSPDPAMGDLIPITVHQIQGRRGRGRLQRVT